MKVRVIVFFGFLGFSDVSMTCMSSEWSTNLCCLVLKKKTNGYKNESAMSSSKLWLQLNDEAQILTATVQCFSKICV